MKTFQDFQASGDKASFILQAIQEFKGTSKYNNAIEAQAYYREENTKIKNRLKWLYDSLGRQVVDKFKANNKIANTLFPKIIKQEVSYLLANGLMTEEKVKEGLGKKFDIKLKRCGTAALVDGVGWGYCFINSKGQFDIDIWRGTEFIPLEDERTGQVRAGIRFWQIDTDKPMWIELYEEDGKTEYKCDKNKIEITEPKKNYIIKTVKDAIEEREVGQEGFSRLPIFPLYANDIRTSRFTFALKQKIDLYDIVYSDFSNNFEDNEDIYWALKNYNGEAGDFLSDLKQYKMINVDEDGDATPHTLEVPYQARETILNMLNKSIYSDAMGLDTSVLAGGSLTNVAIKANMLDLDLKTDEFETGCLDFCDNIIQLYLEYIKKPNEKYSVNFVRNRLVDETEVINNIINSVSASIMSLDTALRSHPMIDDVKLEKQLIDEEVADKFKLEEPKEEVV